MIDAVVATLLAVLRLLGLAALGLTLLSGARVRRCALPTALLLAGAILGAMDATLLALGLRDAAIGADLALTLGALALRWRTTVAAVRELATPLYRLATSSRLAVAVATTLALVYWANAATPPRDTDSLRYHLAHIQQIDAEGRWIALPIVHYAMPFAWQATYLPFIHARLAQGAQLVNLGLWLVTLAAIVAATDTEHRAAQRWIVLLVAVSTIAIVTASTASADAFLVLAATAAALALREEPRGATDGVAAAFAAWVASGSRYQAAALGLAATIVFGWTAGRRRDWRSVGGFGAGALLAGILALPFYLMNVKAFGDPVWPLLARDSSYADVLARGFQEGWGGRLEVGFVGRALWQLFTSREEFPLPQLALASIAAVLVLRERVAPGTRRVAWLIVLFAMVWVIAQPMLYPRFIVFLTGPIVLLSIDAAAPLSEHARVRGTIALACGAGALAMGAYALAFTTFPLHYLVSGDAARFHRFEWYYPVYQWANANLPADARVLVVTRSSESFGLDRWYRRADPSTSAVIDWRSIRDADDLVKTLDSARITHVVFDAFPWSGEDGRAMRRAIESAAAKGDLVELRRFDLTLTRSRFRRGGVPATVEVYVRSPR
ncbi:MAG TPA: hypothetical protein VF761_05045 [Gemmatimonadaceae bacterium]